MAGRRTVNVNTRPVAQQYAGAGERIIEFSSPAGGGLIGFRLTDGGGLEVSVYRYDPTVIPVIGERSNGCPACTICGTTDTRPTASLGIWACRPAEHRFDYAGGA